jgi:DNA-binding transcriptional LysR family regulator
MAKRNKNGNGGRNPRRPKEENRPSGRNRLELRDLRFFRDFYELAEEYEGLEALALQLRQRGHEGTSDGIKDRVKHIGNLIGSELFNITTRTLQPTAYGRGFYSRVMEILRDYDRLFDRENLHTLVFGGINTLLTFLLPGFFLKTRLIHSLSLKHLEIVEEEWGRLHSNVRSGALDIAVGPMIHAPDIRVVSLYKHPWTLVYPEQRAAHYDYLAEQQNTHETVNELFRLLRQDSVIILPETMQPDVNLWAKLNKVGPEGRIIVVPTFALAMRWVAHGLGVAIVPDMRFYGAMPSNLRFLPLPDSFGMGEVAMYLPKKHSTVFAETVATALLEYCEPLRKRTTTESA